MNVKVIIRSAEWSFEEEIPFEVNATSLKDRDFELPLYDEQGNEKESVSLLNCSILEMVGEEDEFHVVMEKNVIENYSEYQNEEGYLVKEFNFFCRPAFVATRRRYRGIL